MKIVAIDTNDSENGCYWLVFDQDGYLNREDRIHSAIADYVDGEFLVASLESESFVVGRISRKYISAISSNGWIVDLDLSTQKESVELLFGALAKKWM